jgi:hypothetical protein
MRQRMYRDCNRPTYLEQSSMNWKWYGALAGGCLILGVAACSDFLSSPLGGPFNSSALSAAFSSTPVGFGDLSSSFVGISAAQFDQGVLWLGGGRGAGFDRGGLMGGGLGPDFSGGVEFGRGMGGGHGPFAGGLGCTGTYNATSQRVECTETRNGLTVTRSAQYKDAAGAVQQAFDTATTNSVNLRSSVTGTLTFDRSADSASEIGDHHHGWGHGRGPGGQLLGDTATILTASTTVNSSSERTTTGLAATSTQRTTNGASRGTESTTGTSSRGNFTASRVVGDTTTGLVVPKPTTTNTFPYPTAGTVTRAMTATVTFAGQAATTVTRREVVTYDGSATAKVVITENGTTRNCTRPLPRGPLTCS